MKQLLCLLLVALLIAHVPQCGGQGQSALSSMASDFASKIKERLQGVIGKKLDELPAGPPDSAGDDDDAEASPSASQSDEDDDGEVDTDVGGPEDMIMPHYPGTTVVMGMPPWDECKSILESCHECTANAFGGVQMTQIMGCLKQCYARADEEDAAGMQSAVETAGGGTADAATPSRRRKRSPHMMNELMEKIDEAVADADLNDENLLKDIMQSLTEDLMAMCNANEVVDCMSDFEDEIQSGCDLPDVPYANMTMMMGGKLQRMQMMIHMKVYGMVKYAVMKRMRLVNHMPRPEPMMKDGAMPMIKGGAMGAMSVMHPAYGMMGMIGAMMHKKPCDAAQQCLADAQIDLDKIMTSLKECGEDEDKRRKAMVCGAQMKHRMCTCQMSKPMRSMAKECMAPGMEHMLRERCSLERMMAMNRIKIINKEAMSTPTYEQCKAHVENKWQCTERAAGDIEGGDPMELHKCKQICARKPTAATGGMSTMDMKSKYKAVSHEQFMELISYVKESMSQHENMTEWYMAVKEKAAEIFDWPDLAELAACMQTHHGGIVDACDLPNAPDALEWQDTFKAHVVGVIHAQIAKAHGMMKFVAERYGDKEAARDYHKENGYDGHGMEGGMQGGYHAMQKSAGSCHDEVNMCLWDKGMDYEAVWKSYGQCYMEQKESEGGDMHSKYGMRVNYAACPMVLKSQCCQCYNTDAFAAMMAECAPSIAHEPVDCARAQHNMAGGYSESMVTDKLKQFLHGALKLLHQMNSRGQSMAHKG